MESIPILKIGSVLMVSIQEELRDSVAENLQEAILEKIEETSARAVLVDITALEIVDTFIARVLTETAESVRFMSARMVLVGMRPAVVMTLIDMGMIFPGLKTAVDIESGLRKLGYKLQRITPAEQRDDF